MIKHSREKPIMNQIQIPLVIQIDQISNPQSSIQNHIWLGD